MTDGIDNEYHYHVERAIERRLRGLLDAWRHRLRAALAGAVAAAVYGLADECRLRRTETDYCAIS